MDEIGFWESAFLWRDPMLAACVGGVLLAYLGFYVVLTRNAFVSAAVSQLAGLGVVLSLLLAAASSVTLPPLAAGVAMGVLGTSLFSFPARAERMTPDGLLAIVVVGASGLSLLFARYLTREYQHVQAALFGDAVVASAGELRLLAGTAFAVLTLHFFLRHRFLLIIFDREAAQAQGMATARWSFLLGLTIALAIAAVTRAMGALPAFAFTVVPPAAALLLAERLRAALGLAVLFALLSAAGGYYLSFTHDLPTGPTMVSLSLLTLVPGGAASLFRARARAGA